MEQLDEKDENNPGPLCAFFRHSRYDIIQARTADRRGWGPVFTFPPRDARAAKRAAQMLLRMHPSSHLEVRYARRARLRDRALLPASEVVVVTRLPARSQSVFHLETAARLRVNGYLEDEALAALDAALRPLSFVAAVWVMG